MASMEAPEIVAAARAARERAVLFDESARGKVRVAGRDRLKYWNNMLTQELKPLGIARLGEGFLTRVSVSGENGYRLILPRAALADMTKALADAGAEPIPEAAVEWLRIEAGTPAFGKDLDETTLPPEAGLE